MSVDLEERLTTLFLEGLLTHVCSCGGCASPPGRKVTFLVGRLTA